MPSIGELLLRLKGEPDPMAKLAAVGGAPGAPGPGGEVLPAPMPLVPGTTAAPAPTAPPQPAAYQSPPDLVQMYSELSARRDRTQRMDNGLALMAASLAHPENRGMIMNSVKRSSSPEDEMGTMLKLRTAQTDLENKANARANLPAMAAKYGLDLDTATYLYDTGGLDNLIAEAEEPSADMKEWRTHKAEAEQAGEKADTFKEWQAKANRAREKWGLTEKYTVTPADPNDPLSEPVIRSWISSDAGGLKELKDDKGNAISVKPVKSETDTEVIWTNPHTQEVVKRIDKQKYEAARQAAAGKGAGEADAATLEGWPKIEHNSNKAITGVDAVLNDPALKTSTGWRGLAQRYIPQTPEYALNERIKELQGGVFLEAYQTLRGTGQITEIEGKKAEQAMARMNAAQSLSDFTTAMKDYQSEIRSLQKLAKAKVDKANQRSPELGGAVEAPKPSKEDVYKKYNIPVD